MTLLFFEDFSFQLFLVYFFSRDIRLNIISCSIILLFFFTRIVNKCENSSRVEGVRWLDSSSFSKQKFRKEGGTPILFPLYEFQWRVDRRLLSVRDIYQYYHYYHNHPLNLDESRSSAASSTRKCIKINEAFCH